ncbi:MAG: pyridoxal phosphate-dependent aminotransferase [Xanthomonadales bacterium]|nr:pyridoxal phosphate-dependent aminotransferase [Xanthomonadales bacterium]
MPSLAARMGRARPSAIMAVAETAKRLRAEGRDIISFSIGVPGFLPGEHVYQAAREALARDSGAYGSNRGREDLLDAIRAHFARLGLPGYAREELVTGVGAKHLLYSLLEALCDPGDRIAFAVPYWTSYRDIADIQGLEVDLLPCPPEQDYKLAPAQLEQALARRPKVLLLNNPNNPTGMVYAREEIAALAAVIARFPDTWVICDDIYNGLIFDGVGYHNPLHAEPGLRDRVIVVDSLSKTYGMPGWRVGFLAGPRAVAEAVVTLNSNHITSLPEVVTAAAVAALSGPQDLSQRKREEFQARRDRVLAALAGLPGVRCPRPQGAFYVFPDVSGCFGRVHRPSGRRIASDLDFCEQLLASHGVACVPGSAFGEPRALRISYTVEEARLAEGLERFRRFVSELG